MDQCLGIWQWSFHAPYPSRRLGTGKRSALRRAAPRPARARNQAGHSKSPQQKTTVQLQQAYLQAALAHRERVQQIEGLQAHRNPLRQAGAKLPGLCLPRRCSCMVDLMSLDPNAVRSAFMSRVRKIQRNGGFAFRKARAMYPDEFAAFQRGE